MVLSKLKYQTQQILYQHYAVFCVTNLNFHLTVNYMFDHASFCWALRQNVNRAFVEMKLSLDDSPFL